MSEPVINLVSPHTGQPVVVPDDVREVVSRANQILEAQLRPLDHIYLNGEWCNFEQTENADWWVSLRVFTPDFDFSRKSRVQDLQSAAAAKEFIMEAFWDFGRASSAKAGEIIRGVRSDLKKMLAG